MMLFRLMDWSIRRQTKLVALASPVLAWTSINSPFIKPSLVIPFECAIYFLLINTQFCEIRIKREGTSLAVQWLRIHLPNQETWVWSLVWEDPQAVKQLGPWATHSYETMSLELMLWHEKPWQSETRAQQLESSCCSPQLEKANMQKQRPSAAEEKNNEGEKKKRQLLPQRASYTLSVG